MVLGWGTGTLGGIDGAKLLEQGFNRQYGLNLGFKFTPGPAMPQLASRIIQEAKANQPASTDLFVGSENHVARMALKGVEWTKVFAHITAPMVDYDNRVIVVTSPRRALLTIPVLSRPTRHRRSWKMFSIPSGREKSLPPRMRLPSIGSA